MNRSHSRSNCYNKPGQTKDNIALKSVEHINLIAREEPSRSCETHQQVEARSMRRKDEITRKAIEKHDELAESFFVTGHDALAQGDFFDSPFTYGRWRIRLQLAKHLPEDGNHLRLLDVGCGTGEELSMYHKSGYRVSGLEPAAEMRRIAAERHPEIGAVVHEGSIYEMPFDKNEFDYVISIEVVRYLEDFLGAAQEVHRVLRPDGKWLFTVTPPTNWTLGPCLNKVRVAGFPVPGIQKLRMYCHSSSYLRGHLPEAGFDVECITPINYVDLMAHILNDTWKGGCRAWIRLWHPLWEAVEEHRVLPWAAGYYFVVAKASE